MLISLLSGNDMVRNFITLFNTLYLSRVKDDKRVDERLV